MENITKEMILSMQVGEKGEGYIYLKNFAIMTSSSGNRYVRGIVQSQVEMTCIAWKTSKAFATMESIGQEMAGKVVQIQYSVTEFAGSLALSLESCDVVPEMDELLFLKQRYEKERYQDGFLHFLQKIISNEAYDLFVDIMELDGGEGSVWDRFSKEFAAMSFHDNCPSGLLAHTFKLLVKAKKCMEWYGWLGKESVFDAEKSQREIDIFLLGLCFHDIGKIFELKNGNYQPNSYITHRILGIEVLMPFKERIVTLYGERGWYMILSILVGHHDEFGDDARTLYAYVVHKIDEFDAVFTLIGQELENNIQENSAGHFIKINGKRLFID